MKDKLYDNADSFAMSFDEEWKNIDCDDLKSKIDKVLELLSDHPFFISNPESKEVCIFFYMKYVCYYYNSPLSQSCVLDSFHHFASIVSVFVYLMISFLWN